MAAPYVDPDMIARAWELHTQGRSVRYIGEQLGVSPSTAANHVRRGRAAEVYIEFHDRAHERSRTLTFLDQLAAWGVDRYETGGGEFEQVVPVILKIVAERNKMLGLYAPTRVAVTDDREPPDVDPAVVAAVAAVRRQAETVEQQQLGGSA